MSNTASPLSESRCSEAAGLLPADPFRALNIHFGMLLGVDDFETLSAYHRGKSRLHNAWNHGPGVIWGLGVDADVDAGEIRVEPGLALDALGRELHLDLAACVNVARWFEEHRDDPDLVIVDEGNGVVSFDAHVVIRFRPCLSRQVPALTEPCDGSGETTAYSRVEETVELLLVPGSAPESYEFPGAYHRLRLLFALEEPLRDEADQVIESDREVLEERKRILELVPAEEQPRAYLEAFRRFAALDVIDLQPPTAEAGEDRSLFPGLEPGTLVLAEALGLTLTPAGDSADPTLSLAGGIDNTVRLSHVATQTIQELLNGPLFAGLAAAVGDSREEGLRESDRTDEQAPVDAGGPRLVPGSLNRTDRQIAFSVDRQLAAASVTPQAVSLTVFDGKRGWAEVEVQRIRLSSSGTRVALVFRNPVEASQIRVLLRGTGPTPLLGADFIPFAGSPDDSPASEHNGNDLVVMHKRS